LLIVIAIIALIAAILFPVFARVREKARSAACQSNMKQIALAFIQYSADYDERLPHAWDSDLAATPSNVSTCSNCIVSTGTDEPMVWPAKIEPYTKSRQVFTCPDAITKINSPCNPTLVASAISVWKDGTPVIGSKGGSGWYLGASQAGYGYNTFYLGGNRYVGLGNCLNQAGVHPSLPYSNGIGAALSSIADAAGTVLICDNSFSNQGSTNASAFIDFPSLHLLGVDAGGDFQCKANGTTTDPYDSIPTRHSDGLNVAFLDGHVKWMKKETLMYGLNSESCDGTGAGAAIHNSTDSKFLWNRF
jgi:prepilin-type processing-associated H-X9-DG protein